MSEGWFQKALAEGIWHQKLNCFMQGPVLSVLGPGVPPRALLSQARLRRDMVNPALQPGLLQQQQSDCR